MKKILFVLFVLGPMLVVAQIKHQQKPVANPTPKPAKSTNDALDVLLNGTEKAGDGKNGQAGNKGSSQYGSGGYYGGGSSGAGSGAGSGGGGTKNREVAYLEFQIKELSTYNKHLSSDNKYLRESLNKSYFKQDISNVFLGINDSIKPAPKSPINNITTFGDCERPIRLDELDSGYSVAYASGSSSFDVSANSGMLAADSENKKKCIGY